VTPRTDPSPATALFTEARAVPGPRGVCSISPKIDTKGQRGPAGRRREVKRGPARLTPGWSASPDSAGRSAKRGPSAPQSRCPPTPNRTGNRRCRVRSRAAGPRVSQHAGWGGSPPVPPATLPGRRETLPPAPHGVVFSFPIPEASAEAFPRVAFITTALKSAMRDFQDIGGKAGGGSYRLKLKKAPRIKTAHPRMETPDTGGASV